VVDQKETGAMPEDSTDQTDDTKPDDAQAPPATDDLGDTGKKALDAERAARKESDRRFKALEKEMQQVRQSSMSEAEKAVAEAKAAGRAEVRGEYGQKLARTQFDAAAGRRNPDFDTASALDYLDLSRFVGEDGEPDAKAIKAAVERLVPAPTGGPPSFDGGARTPAPPAKDMNDILRRATGRA
jgi:hypothetical protein